MIKFRKIKYSGELVLQAERKRVQLRPSLPDLDNANVGKFFVNCREVPIRHFPFVLNYKVPCY